MASKVVSNLEELPLAPSPKVVISFQKTEPLTPSEAAEN